MNRVEIQWRAYERILMANGVQPGSAELRSARRHWFAGASAANFLRAEGVRLNDMTRELEEYLASWKVERV